MSIDVVPTYKRGYEFRMGHIGGYCLDYWDFRDIGIFHFGMAVCGLV
jgi:hypothetical protein